MKRRPGSQGRSSVPPLQLAIEILLSWRIAQLFSRTSVEKDVPQAPSQRIHVALVNAVEKNLKSTCKDGWKLLRDLFPFGRGAQVSGTSIVLAWYPFDQFKTDGTIH